MAARIGLAKAANATSGPAANGLGASIRIRAGKPSGVFVVSGTWTGSVLIQHSVDSPNVADADAAWVTLFTLTANDQQSWHDPLYRVRASTAGVTTGAATVYILE